MNLPEIFLKLAKIFEENNFNLYMVGGTSRDFLLGREISDFDFVTDATCQEMKSFLDFKEPFANMGSIHLHFQNHKVDITTLRKEGEYQDFRHPKYVEFIKDLKVDSYRRDFTVNAIYIDSNGKIYDFHNGIEDLKNRLISMIGDPTIRFQEDPLRILRALRFSLIYGFSISTYLHQKILKSASLLKKISYAKCVEEIDKMKKYSLEHALWILKSNRIDDYIPIDYNSTKRLNVIDLHCDTLTKIQVKEEGLYNPKNTHLSLKKMSEGEYLMQAFAIFLPLIRYQHPFEEVKKYIALYEKEMEENQSIISQVRNYQQLMNNKANKKMSALLTIEDAGLLENNLDNLIYVYEKGVRMITLTWNYPNGVGFPNFNLNSKLMGLNVQPNTDDGLTDFGIQLVRKMNELGIIIDVSHLSDRGFFDCIKYSTKPIVASHSNARSICQVVRNMTDEMLIALNKNHGVIGINYCPDFISSNKEDQIPDIVKHINHIKDIAGIDVISLGSDFDGIPTPKGMSDSTKTHELKEALIKEGYTQEEIDKIFYLNFLRVFKKVCNK